MKRGLVVAIGAAALAVAPAAANAPKPVTVKVGDDYYLPVKKTVRPGTKIVWKWLSVNGNTHDVKLKKGPRGVKKFQSDPAAAYYTYKRTLKVKGKYSIICTFHEGMVQTITVK
jgi:plastocyanin